MKIPHEPIQVRTTREAMVTVGIPVADGVLVATLDITNACRLLEDIETAIRRARIIIGAN